MFIRDYLDSEIHMKHPFILDLLLIDKTTNNNIIWATEHYIKRGIGYDSKSQISVQLIIGKTSKIVTPRVDKSIIEQAKRIKKNAEVFTPSWVCNKQNNLIDETWFDKKSVFNIEQSDEKKWISTETVNFSNVNKTWKDYVNDIRLEITCGEAPYIVSRYDTVSGEEISIEKRIGVLDRKFRVIKENASSKEVWIEFAIKALKATYGYEFQGDNLLIARENILMSFGDYYVEKFNEQPPIELLLQVVDIITWNIWQMDGIKNVVPFSCQKEEPKLTLFDFGLEKIDDGYIEDVKICNGCKSGNIKLHNGKYSMIMDWAKNKKIKFVNLIGENNYSY